MSDRRKDLRPREKLQARGPEALSDYELLMAMIGSGNAQADVTKIARDVQKLITEKGSQLTYEDLLGIKSLGPAKAASIMAAFELWRRQFEVSERPIIDSPEKAVEQLTDIRDKNRTILSASRSTAPTASSQSASSPSAPSPPVSSTRAKFSLMLLPIAQLALSWRTTIRAVAWSQV